jgi:tetratricopeptide (TPR) repeat protein
MFTDEPHFSFKSLFVPFTTLKASLYIIIIGLLVFGNMLFNGFVWDDKTFIILNPDVYTLNIPYLFGQNLFNDTVYYRPIPATYFATLYSLFTTNPFPYHVLQLMLHILNTILLFKFLSSFFKKSTSFVLSVIFLVHPMQVESVSYIAQTVSPLFFFFGILAMMGLKKINTFRLTKFSGLLLLAMLTKETGIVFIFICNLYIFLYKKSKLLLIAATSLFAVGIYLLIRFFIGHVYFAKSMLIAPIANIPLQERLLNIPSVIFYYFKTFFFPLNLGINQHWIITNPTLSNFYLPLFYDLLIALLIFFIGLLCFKKSKVMFKTYIFFIAWLLLGLAFHSQIAPLDMTVADRWFYFTIVGLLGILGVVFELLPKNKLIYRQILLVLAIIFICAISIRTMIRNTDWQNAIKLYTHDIAIDDNFDIENSLGWEYIQSQQYNLAEYHIKRSIDFWPEWDKNWYNLGVAYHYSEKTDLAKNAYQTALKHNPDYVQVQENLGYLLTYYYNPNDAKVFLTKALKKHPQRPKLWYFRALANYKLGKIDDAKADIAKAYNLNPYDPTIANIYTQMMNNVPIEFQNSQKK